MTGEDWPGPAKYRVFGWLTALLIVGLCVYLTVL